MNWVRDAQEWSEVFTPAGSLRPHYGSLVSILESFTRSDIDHRERLQSLSLVSQGITFTVHGEKEGVERIVPFDFVPRSRTGASSAATLANISGRRCGRGPWPTGCVRRFTRASNRSTFRSSPRCPRPTG